MKIYFFIPLILLASCASNPKPHIVQMPVAAPGNTMSPDVMESVRYSENIKAYPVGRYIDPNNDLVMHERHSVYRVETTAKWNLHPNGSPTVPLGPPLAIIDTARHNAPINAEIIAEVNKQKAATQALLDQGTKLKQTLSQLSGAFQVTKQLGEQNQQIKQQLAATQTQLDQLERELRKDQAEQFGINQNTKNNKW